MARRLRALFGVSALLAIAMPQAALAAPPPTPVTVTMVSADTAYYQFETTYVATISPIPPAGMIYFEYSYDNQTWLPAAQTFSYPGGTATAVAVTPNTQAEGVRSVRARYEDTDNLNYANSTSANTVSQTVAKYTPVLINLTVKTSTGGTDVMPSTSPVKYRVEADGYAPTTTVHFEEETSPGVWTERAQTSMVDAFAGHFAAADGPALGSGSHKVRARIEGDANNTEATVSTTIATVQGAIDPTIYAFGVLQANHPIVLTVGWGGADQDILPTGTLTVMEAATVRGSVPVTNSSADVTVPARPAGTYTFRVEYSGDTNYAPATSADLVVNLVADTLDATNIGIQYSTFYPVKDGYRDTVAFKGTRAEPISVTAKVYNSTGTRVKTLTASSATGTYSLVWTGRNSSGTILAAGKYKVVQTLKDAAGITKTVTGYVNLSKKKLVTYTKSITKLGYDYDAKGKGGTGTISTSSTSGWIKLKGGSSGYAIAGWELTLPSAMFYKSMTYKLYAKSAITYPASSMAVQNFNTCARSTSTAWNDGCFDRWDTLGNGNNSLMWYSEPASVSANRSGRYVRVLAVSDATTLYVYKARVTVTYQLLE